MPIEITNRVEMIRTSTGETEDVAVYLSETPRPHWGTHEHPDIFGSGRTLVPGFGFELIDGLFLLAIMNLRGANPIHDGFWFKTDSRRINLNRANAMAEVRPAMFDALNRAFEKYSIRIATAPTGLNRNWADQLALVNVKHEIVDGYKDPFFKSFNERASDQPDEFEP
jgi:hypothetical protein